MLTGTGIRVNTDSAADEFGASTRFPRGLASDGTMCILFDARLGFELNVQTGIATRIGSVANFLINEGQVRGATYNENTDQFVFWGNTNNRFYAYNRQNGVASNLGLQFASAWDFWGLAFLNGVLYAIDRGEDALYIIDTSAGTATRVGTATEFGIGTGNVQSLCVYNGNLYGFSGTLNRMILIDETDGTASIVNDMDLPDGSPEAAVEHGGNLYYAGSSDDALFRMYDVLWDETITNPEIDEESSGTLLDLSTVSQDAASFSLQGTNPSWVSVSGTDLVATNAPSVTGNTDYDVSLRATRDGINVDKTIQVTVRNTTITPTNTAPAFDESSYSFTDVDIADNTVVGTVSATDADNDTLAYSLTGTDASKFDISSSGQITNAEELDHETTYNFNVVADDGTDTTSVAVSVTTTAQPDATLTISTTETNIVENQVIDIDIVSDIDIDDFTASDVDVTNGTRGALTETDAQNWVLSVTPGVAGTMTVSIDEDVVTPGNAAASQDFTVNEAAEVPAGLSGSGEIVSATPNFGGVENYARGATSDGTTAYHFGRTQGYTLNTETGVSTASGSARSGSGTIRGAAYHNNQVIVYVDNRNIYTWTAGLGFNTVALISDLRYATGSGITGTPNINAIESLNDVLYVVDGTNDGLYRVADDGELHRIGSGFSNRNISGLVAHEGVLLATDNTNDRLIHVDQHDGTITNVANNAMPSSRTVDFLLSHGHELYGGAFSAGLLRFYNVRWNDTIPRLETEEGTDTDFDLTEHSTDANVFVFASGYTAPSWLSIVGTNLHVDDTSSVNENVDYTVELEGQRDGVGINQDITLRILARASEPPVFSVVPLRVVDERDSTTFDLSSHLTNADTLAFADGYTPPSWLTLSGESLVVTNAPTVTANSDNVVELTASNEDGDTDRNVTVRVRNIQDPPAWTTVPRQDVNEGSSQTFDLSSYLTDADSMSFRSGYTPPSWLSITGFNLIATNAPSVSNDTDFTVELRATNEDGNTNRNVTVRVIQVAAPPTWDTDIPRQDIDELTSDTINVANFVFGEDSIAFASGYTPPTWLTISSGVLSIDGTQAVTANTDYDVDLTATNTDGSEDKTITIRIIDVPIPITFSDESIDNQSWILGIAESLTLPEITGGEGAITYSISPTLPDGMTFTASTREVSGTPTELFRSATFTYTATDSDGNTAELTFTIVVSIATPAQLHKTLLFKEPVNYLEGRVAIRDTETIVSEMTDNDYGTYSSETDVDIDVSDSDGDATAIDYIFLKTKNVDSYSFTPVGGNGIGFVDRNMPVSYRTIDEREVSTSANGYQHELYPLPDGVTATSVRLEFSGSSVEIYAVMLLEVLAEINDGEFLDILPDKRDRSGQVTGTPNGSVRRISPFGASRWKWETEYLLKVRPSGTSQSSVHAFQRLLENNPHIAHVQEFTRYPSRVYPAAVESLRVPANLRGAWKDGGEVVRFRVAEL